jgi:hypothetical protein
MCSVGNVDTSLPTYFAFSKNHEMKYMYPVQFHMICILISRQNELLTFWWLPINTHPGQAIPLTALKTPAYQVKDKTIAHFIGSATLQQLELWNESDLTTNTTNVDLHISIIIAWAITTPSGPTTAFPLQSVPAQYIALVQTQQLIGWDQVIVGILTPKWTNQLGSLHPSNG